MKVLCIFVHLYVVIFLFCDFRGTCPSAFATQLQLPWGSSPLTLSKHTNTSMRSVLFSFCFFIWLFFFQHTALLKPFIPIDNVHLCESFCFTLRCIMQKRSGATNRVRAKTRVTKKREKSLMMATTMITTTISSRMGRSGWTVMRSIPW